MRHIKKKSKFLKEDIEALDILGSRILEKLETISGLSNEQRNFYAGDPVAFFIDVLGVYPWDKQQEILESLVANSRVTVRSCHSAGKTFTAAGAVLWYLSCFIPSTVVTTAPTGRQVRAILWQEVAARYGGSKVPIGGRLLTQELKMGPKWFGTGFSTDEQNIEQFQGFHNESILVIVDEAGGVARNIFIAIEGLLASGNAKLLLIGNPIDPSGDFGKSFKSPLYKKIHISAFDTPNFKGEKVEFPYLITPQWVREMEIEWGANSPLYEARILGEFPTFSEDVLIPLSWCERAKNSNLKAEGIRALGVDIARYGADDSVAILREGNVVIGVWKWSKSDTMATAGRIVNLIRDTSPLHVFIDVIGIGSGVVDSLLEQGFDVKGVNVAERSSYPERFMNLRSEIYWNLRDRFESQTIKIPDDDNLINELTNIKMLPPTSRGQQRLESKEEMKKRIGRSPDKADALALAFFEARRGGTSVLGSLMDTSMPLASGGLMQVFEEMPKVYISDILNYNKIRKDHCPQCDASAIGIISWFNSCGACMPGEATMGKCLLCKYQWEI